MSKQNKNEPILRLTKLIKGLSAKSDLARFRNDYRDVARHFSDDVRIVLNKARDAAEKWVADSSPEAVGSVQQPVAPSEAPPATPEQVAIPTVKEEAPAEKAKLSEEQVKVPAVKAAVPNEKAKASEAQTVDPVEQAKVAAEQWHELYREGRPRIPVSFFAALLRKLPATSVAPKIWRSFLAGCRSGEIIESLVVAGHVTKKSISDWLGADFADFYASAVLDMAIDNKMVKPSAKVWREITGQGERPSGLIARADLLVWIYDRWHAPEADTKLMSYLADSPAAEKQKMFGALLRRPTALARCVKSVSTSDAQRRNAPKPDASLLADLLRFLTEAQRSNEIVDAMVASVNLGLLRLYPAIPGGASAGEVQSPVESQAREAAVGAALAIARRLEEDSNVLQSSLFIVLRGSELQTVIGEHIKGLGSLASAGSGDSKPIERQSQYQRHAGQREILQKITGILSGDLDESAIHEELEVLLFNAGVRRLGKVGDHIPFDPRLHRSKTAGTLAGENVEVLKEGYQLGDEDDGLILAKVVVRATEE